MKLYHRNDHIVRFNNGDIWHFFSQNGKGIYLRCMKKNGIWKNEVDLVASACDSFSVSIDCHDHLHLVYQDHSGEIVYMEYNGSEWNKQLIHQYDTSSYIVQFPTIIPLNRQVHVIFAVGTIPPSGVWTLYHCYSNGNDWIKSEITRYTDGKQTSPFYLDHDQKSIHMVYRSLYRNQHRLFYCHFDGTRNRWSMPENLSRNLGDCNMPGILVKNSKLHLAWTTIRNSNLQVMYRNRPLRPYFKTSTEKDALLSAGESNCSDPQLLWADNQLWCIWYQNGDIYCCSSPDDGITWDQPKPLGWSHIDNCHCIRYSSNHPEDQSRCKMHRTFAKLDDGLEIPILGKINDPFKAMPTVKIEDLPARPPVGQSNPEQPETPQQEDGLSSALIQDDTDFPLAAPQNVPNNLPEEGQMGAAGQTPPTSSNEMAHSEPAGIEHVPQSTPSNGTNPANYDAVLDTEDHMADNSQSMPLSNAQEPETETKEPPIKTDNAMQQHLDSHEKAEQLPADQQPGNTINHVLSLIQELNKVNGLRTKFQALLGKSQPEKDSTYYIYQLDVLLNSWMKKGEEIQAEHQAIMREIDSLRRRSIESRRQWEIFMEEFEEIKALLEKNLRVGLLRKIIG